MTTSLLSTAGSAAASMTTAVRDALSFLCYSSLWLYFDSHGNKNSPAGTRARFGRAERDHGARWRRSSFISRKPRVWEVSARLELRAEICRESPMTARKRLCSVAGSPDAARKRQHGADKTIRTKSCLQFLSPFDNNTLQPS